MKILVFLIISFIGNSAHAFLVQTECHFTPFEGSCSIYNDSQFPLRCSLQIEGQTRSGAFFRGKEDVILYPGQNTYGYVRANNGYIDPLIYVSGKTNCH